MKAAAARHWILTGGRGAGKTQLCTRLVQGLKAAGLDVAGILSPGIFVNGEKAGIQALDIRSGETRLLARLAAFPQPNSPTPRWSFDSHAMQWAEAVLLSSPPCDLLVVDELGPLELIKHRGWARILPRLQAGEFPATLLVVRPELQERLSASLSGTQRIISISPEDSINVLASTLLPEILSAVNPG